MAQNIKSVFIVLIALSFDIAMFGQAPQFSQPYANPLLLNPAFSGETRGTRIVMNYRNQWAALSDSYRTFAFGADKYLPEMRSGMGISVWKDVAGVNSLYFSQYAAYFSHKVRISKTQAFKAGIRLSHVTRGIDTSRMLFADQVVRDNAPVSVEPNIIDRVNYQEIGIGFLYHSNTWWSGFSMANINKPNNSLLNGGDAILPVKYSLHGGATLYQKGKRSPEALKMAWQYKAAQNWDQFDIGIYYRYEQFVMGTWYRGLPLKKYSSEFSNNDALVLLVGAELKNGWKFGYSYDMTISRLTNKSGGSHEISLSFEKPSKKRRKVRIPPCVEF